MESDCDYLDDPPGRDVGCTIAAAFAPYAEAAATRLSIRHPTLVFKAADGILSAIGPDAPRVLNERILLHALYREKIYQETLPARLALFQALALP